MEALAVDKLIDEAHFHSDVALAIAAAMDITLQSHNFVTVPMLDLRFAAFETKIESRFSALEKSIADAKVWASSLYAALVVFLFGLLAANHHWLVSREDQMQVRTDQRFQLVDGRFQQIDARFQQVDARFQQVDAHFQHIEDHLHQVDLHLQQIDVHLQQQDIELKEIHALLMAPHHRRP